MKITFEANNMKELIDFVCQEIKYNPKGKFYNTKSPVQTQTFSGKDIYIRPYENVLTAKYIKDVITLLSTSYLYDLYINYEVSFKRLDRDELLNKILVFAKDKYGEITRSILDQTDIIVTFHI